MGGVLGFDFGDRRIGVALAPEGISVAIGLPTIIYTGRKDLRRQLERLIEEKDPDMLVVGLPLNLDGSRGERCAISEAFAERLRGWFGLPVRLHDERLTTVEAERVRLEAGTESRKAREEGLIDRAAAVLMLQSWIDGGGLAIDGGGLAEEEALN
jgi:putative Holliday junction resolvase